MDRRAFLRSSIGGAAALALGPAAWRSALAGAVAVEGDGPYGPLGPADENGLRLPGGFRSRVIAQSGTPVAGTGYVWHGAPDGGATFATEDGGWIYVSNSEIPVTGGAGAVRFDADGGIVDAYRVLAGTSMNCAGGPTPWGTWISCEEHDFGRSWECDPFGRELGVALPALGTFAHEAVAVDPRRGHLYLTEDKPDGRFYRFTPDRYPDLDRGTLAVAQVAQVAGADGGEVTWLPVPEPGPRPGEQATRHQVPDSTAFDGGEGCWHHRGTVYFTTKGDNRVWALDTESDVLRLVYDGSAADAVLRGVDNVTVAANGDVFVAEDGDDMQICLITTEDEGSPVVTPVVEIVGHARSEVTGPAFDPSGARLYFSSQRGPGEGGPGITYEVAGPFRGLGGNHNP